MNDSQCLALCASVLVLNGQSTTEASIQAAAIGEAFGLSVSPHTEKELGLANPFSGDDLSLLPGRKSA